ncbi:hypothetical protein Pcinc_039641 [Petrolisthes cinctipes]|uniref:Uncharacterized protein n=1 Tax=Petrolisthes cinctipes TaxID=88211 RepID=A0AAE1BNA5_PETCI|nr:hypothetical protein Pcinc_039641 [Petrolisthes cinctipes]
MNGRTLKRKPKLVRSENVCDHSSGLDSIIRESLLQIAWPISASFSAEDSLYVRAQGGNFAIRKHEDKCTEALHLTPSSSPSLCAAVGPDAVPSFLPH